MKGFFLMIGFIAVLATATALAPMARRYFAPASRDWMLAVSTDGPSCSDDGGKTWWPARKGEDSSINCYAADKSR